MIAVGYPYEDLEDGQFERLVVEFMRKLFGPGVQGFAPGKDGGRDSRFNGTAERFPSAVNPWSGLMVGQAKHTAALNAHFGETDFSSDAKSSVVSEEIGRLKKLKADGELEFYILFSNRRLGGVAGPKIEARIAKEVGLSKQRVHLVGVERMDALLIEYPDAPRLANISMVDGPLLVNSEDLAEVILAIAEELDAPTASSLPAPRISFTEKNLANEMSADFAAALSRRYLNYTPRIDDFLAAPENAEIRERYDAAVEDFQLKIIAKRKNHQSFDEVFNHLVDTLVKRDLVLRGHERRRLVRVMLFYMYWHCDIGEEPGKEPDAAPE